MKIDTTAILIRTTIHEITSVDDRGRCRIIEYLKRNGQGPILFRTLPICRRAKVPEIAVLDVAACHWGWLIRGFAVRQPLHVIRVEVRELLIALIKMNAQTVPNCA
jgi:hypothetical protein